MAATITVNANTDKNALLQEAAMQSKMLSNLNTWLKALLALSGIGVAVVWWGFSGESTNFLAIISGAVLSLASVLGMMMVQRGIMNGKRNVDRIMTLADRAKH